MFINGTGCYSSSNIGPVAGQPNFIYKSKDVVVKRCASPFSTSSNAISQRHNCVFKKKVKATKPDDPENEIPASVFIG